MSMFVEDTPLIIIDLLAKHGQHIYAYTVYNTCTLKILYKLYLIITISHLHVNIHVK